MLEGSSISPLCVGLYCVLSSVVEISHVVLSLVWCRPWRSVRLFSLVWWRSWLLRENSGLLSNQKVVAPQPRSVHRLTGYPESDQYPQLVDEDIHQYKPLTISESSCNVCTRTGERIHPCMSIESPVSDSEENDNTDSQTNDSTEPVSGNISLTLSHPILPGRYNPQIYAA